MFSSQRGRIDEHRSAGRAHAWFTGLKPLLNRRILLIGIGFYDYETAIADEFRRLGAEVRVEDERPSADRGALAPWRRWLHRTGTGIAQHRAAMLRRAGAHGRLDYIVVIKGALLDEDFLIALRAIQPAAYLISYQWDSLRRFPELVARQALFDRVLTFDQGDAACFPDFRLRPTFFRPELATAARVMPTIDLCFVGWLHHDRLDLIEALRTQCATLGLSAFFYLFTGIRTGIRLRLAGRGRDVHVRSIRFADYARHVAAARVIVDLPHPDQTGLTMRACESVGTGRKLLTTAAGVVAYDFYRPENVAILDPTALRIDPSFITSDPVPLPLMVVNKYSLTAWALDVLGVTEPAGFLSRSDDASTSS